MKRRTSVAVAKRNESVVQRIRTLKAEHPFWGYRHIGPICGLSMDYRSTINAYCG